jgi:lysophospholipase L1-like esterase
VARLVQGIVASLLLGLNAPGENGQTARAPDRSQPQPISDKEWHRLIPYHRGELTLRRADVCFVGDSLTEFWNAQGKLSWQSEFRRWRAVNCGIAADRTEHILYRLGALDLGKAQPRVMVLLMGTNNLGMENPDPPETVAKACRAAVRYIHRVSPETRIVLLTIPPSGGEAGSALRRSIRVTNELLRPLGSESMVTVMDTYSPFVDSKDDWLRGMTLDGTHFSADGYAVLARVLKPRLVELLGEPTK